MNSTVKNIRAKHIQNSVKGWILTVLAGGVAFGMWYGSVGYKNREICIGIAIFLGLYSIFAFVLALKELILAIKPLKNKVFKKYGSPENIEYIYRVIQDTTEYEDDNMVISQSYICHKREKGLLITCNDVLAIRKEVHRTYFVVDYYQIVIIDKYGDAFHFRYKANEEFLVNTLIDKIKSKCRYAVVGDNQYTAEYIKKNRVSLEAVAQDASLLAQPPATPMPLPGTVKIGNYNIIKTNLANGFIENAQKVVKEYISSTIEELGPTRKTDLMKVVFSKVNQEYANEQGIRTDLIICAYYQIAFDEIMYHCGDMNVLISNYSTSRVTGLVKQEIHKYIQMLVRIQLIIDGAIAVSVNYSRSSGCSREAYARICNELNSYIDDFTAWNKLF